ncbi:MAG: hypothetical protein HN916_00370 [Anaerolineae bacterium]|jgi:hypothetical protein|nr:hypothetical protein [Anaerolineae bacterium]MBT7989777.1 hypothetical protein [Anaerolineae bacterium]
MKRKLTLLITTLMLILSACEITPTPLPEPETEPAQVDAVPEAEEVVPEPTATFTPESAENDTPAEEEVAAPEETEEKTEQCLELLTPLDKADLPAEGKVVFSWTAHDSAESYSLNFIFPDGLTLEFATNETTKNRYMDGFSMHPAYNQSGEHQWNVTALNAAGEEICQSDFFTFTKPQTPENKPQGDGGCGACGITGGETGGNVEE